MISFPGKTLFTVKSAAKSDTLSFTTELHLMHDHVILTRK